MKISLKQEDIEVRMAVIKEIDHAEHFMNALNQYLPEEKICYILSLGTFYSTNEVEGLFDLLVTIRKFKREEIRILGQPIDILLGVFVSIYFFYFVSFYNLASYLVFTIAILYFVCFCLFFLYTNKKYKIKKVLLKKGLSTEALRLLVWNKDNQMEKELKEKKYYHFSQCINCGDPIRLTNEEIEIDEKLFEQRLTEWHQFLQKNLNEINLGVD